MRRPSWLRGILLGVLCTQWVRLQIPKGCPHSLLSKTQEQISEQLWEVLRVSNSGAYPEKGA